MPTPPHCHSVGQWINSYPVMSIFDIGSFSQNLASDMHIASKLCFMIKSNIRSSCIFYEVTQCLSGTQKMFYLRIVQPQNLQFNNI